MASRYQQRSARSHSPSNDGFESGHVVIDASTPPRITTAPPPPRVGKTTVRAPNTTAASGSELAVADISSPAPATAATAAPLGGDNPVTSLVDRASRAPALTERAGRIYNLWLAHARGLYGFCTTHLLEWPSMTVQWLPDSRREIPARDYSMAQLVVGTAAPIGAPNWVGVYQVFLHCELDDEDGNGGDFDEDDVERFEGVAHNFRDVAPLMHRHSRFMTGGPVLRVRPMPSRPQLLAVRTRTSPDTLLVDFSRRRAEPEEGNIGASPDVLLKGHRGSGRAMAWCEQVASRLATGGADNLVNVYWLGSLVESAGRGGTTIQQPGMTLRGHTDVVDDISWHGSHGAVLSSCSRAGELILWDLRASKQDVQHERPHGDAPVYTTQFHPTAHFMLATGGADNTTRVWDIRKFKEPCAALVGHSDAVRGVEWAPFNETVLLSYAADGTTRCWDLAKRFSSASQNGDDTRDARASIGDDRVCSADLVFTHAGHTAGVREATWAPFPEDEWTVASVCDNNMLQLWTPHRDTYNDEVVCEEDEEVT